MRIGFIVCVDDEIEKGQMFGIKYMPVWAFTLASYLKDFENLETFLYDTRIEKKSQTPKADFYFISGINQDEEALLDYQKTLKAKYPKAKLILGGPIVSSFHLAGKIERLNAFDHLFMGDGENAIGPLVQSLMNNKSLPHVIENKVKFAIKNARTMDFELVSKSIHEYYGGVVEVSRGCPFLCEFCDIRTKPDNNVASNKDVSLIVSELNQFSKLGVTNILFACDNFIGTPTWAEALCDAIIEWKKTSGFNPRLYTWLTINVSDHPRLLQKLKLAGFDMFFIGIESFGTDQLLETAKLQNIKHDMVDTIKSIQSYGFIIVAGLIFGFDTDKDDVVDRALRGIKESGLISGDPSLLTALPGTPLYRRMEKSGRLRRGKLGLGGKKYATNILYLRSQSQMIEDFIRFVHEFNAPTFQYERFENFLKTLGPSLDQSEGDGYINVPKILKDVMKSSTSFFSATRRLTGVLNSPEKVKVVIRAYRKTKATPNAKMTHFYFWLFNWSNSILKYGNLSAEDFDIDSVSRDFNLKDIIPEDYETDFFEPIPVGKIRSQRQATIRALKKISHAQ